MRPRATKMAPRRSKTPLRRPKTLARRPKTPPRRPKTSPRGPKRPPGRPKTPPGVDFGAIWGSKMLPKWLPKRSPNTVGNETPKSLILHNPPWFWVVFSFQLGSPNGPKWKENGFQNGSENEFGKRKPKMTPKTAPGRPKTVPGRPQDAPGRPRNL